MERVNVARSIFIDLNSIKLLSLVNRLLGFDV